MKTILGTALVVIQFLWSGSLTMLIFQLAGFAHWVPAAAAGANAAILGAGLILLMEGRK